MGLTRTDLYSEKLNQVALFAKVLGHPARVAILDHLLSRDSCVCGDLVDEIGLAQATISQHLKELKKMDLIQGTITGTSVCYCINFDKLKECREIMMEFFDSDHRESKNCK